MNADSKIHLFGIISIVGVIISGIWIFGFDDELFGFITFRSDTPLTRDTVLESTQQNNYEFENNNNDDEYQKEISKSVQEPKSENTIIQKNNVTEPETKNASTQTLVKSTQNSENNFFILRGEGTSYEATKALSKKVIFELDLKPVPKTDLKEFTFRDGGFFFGTYDIDIDEGKVTINDNIISIESIVNDSMDPVVKISGKVDGSLMKQNEVHVKFENQLFYIHRDATRPQHLDLDGIISQEQKPK